MPVTLVATYVISIIILTLMFQKFEIIGAHPRFLTVTFGS